MIIDRELACSQLDGNKNTMLRLPEPEEIDPNLHHKIWQKLLEPVDFYDTVPDLQRKDGEPFS